VKAVVLGVLLGLAMAALAGTHSGRR